MTLTIAIGASDGLILAADGRTSNRDEVGTLIPKLDDAVKLIRVHDAPMAVMLSGRAEFKGKVVAEWCKEFLDAAISPDPPWPNTEIVAAALWKSFRELNHQYPPQPGDGLVGLVASYTKAGEFDLWEFAAPDAFGGPQPARNFEPELIWEQPPGDTAQAVRRIFGKSLEDYDELAAQEPPADDSQFTAPHRFAGETADIVRQNLLDGLRSLAAEDDSIMNKDGVGGHWLIAKLTPEDLVISREPVGPFADFDAQGHDM